jgi:pantothenate kinase
MKIPDILTRISDAPKKGRRRLVGLIGAPASGKTTLAHALASAEPTISVVPMDGFHLDNTILEKRGLLARKGAPDTFDAAGFIHLLGRLAAGEDAIYPLFDRSTERSIAGAGEITTPCETILVEGNYLLLDRPEWRPLRHMWDLTFKLNVPRDDLRARLLERWRLYGYPDEEAVRKTDQNDLPNADLVDSTSFPADVLLTGVDL